MTKAYSTLNVKSVTDSNDERIITGIASTPSTDRDDDIIEPKGATFSLPIPLLWQHNHNQPIGEVTSATITDEGIEITAKIVKIEEEGDLKRRIDEAWQSIKSGLVKCLSVGFKIKEYTYIENSWGIHIKEWDWYELSAVTIPANPDAVITSAKDIKKAFSDAHNIDQRQPEHSDPEPETTPVDKSSSESPSDEATTPERTITLVDPNKGGVKLL